MIASGSVQQHKTALGFSGLAKQESTCVRIRNLLRSYDMNYSDYARSILEIAPLNHPLMLDLDRTNWNINLLVLPVVISLCVKAIYFSLNFSKFEACCFNS